MALRQRRILRKGRKQPRTYSMEIDNESKVRRSPRSRFDRSSFTALGIRLSISYRATLRDGEKPSALRIRVSQSSSLGRSSRRSSTNPTKQIDRSEIHGWRVSSCVGISCGKRPLFLEQRRSSRKSLQRISRRLMDGIDRAYANDRVLSLSLSLSLSLDYSLDASRRARNIEQMSEAEAEAANSLANSPANSPAGWRNPREIDLSIGKTDGCTGIRRVSIFATGWL